MGKHFTPEVVTLDRSPTIKDVAARAGVSLGTVSNFINGTKTVAAGTARRIEAAIDELEFVPNRAVRSLRGERTDVIGFVVPDATNPFFTELARHVEDVASSHGCVVVFCDTAGDDDREQMYLRRLAEMRVRGVVLTSVDHRTANLASLHAVKAPIVLLGDDKPGLNMSSLSFDYRRGGLLAMSHLLSSGRRDIVFAGGPGGGRLVEARYLGAQDAMRDHADGAAVGLRRFDATGRSVRERAALADRILNADGRPDGIICGNDMIALAILNALLRAGVRVPADIAIVGHDDIEAAQQAVIPLTTVRQPIRELGRLAAELLIKASQDPGEPTHVMFDPELVVRETTVASPQSTGLPLGLAPGGSASHGVD